jgi:prophage regulatory protein
MHGIALCFINSCKGSAMKNTTEITPMYEIYRMATVTRITGLSRSSIYRLEALGLFPARVKLSSSASGWRSKDVHSWISSRPLAAAAKGVK